MTEDQFTVTELEMQLLCFLSESAAQERKFGEDGWMRRPDEMEESYAAAINSLHENGLIEIRGMWMRPTKDGESVLAQVQASKQDIN